MVVLAVGFRPNTALGAGKLETFRNGAYLVNKKQQKHQSKMFMQLVTVLPFMTMPLMM